MPTRKFISDKKIFPFTFMLIASIILVMLLAPSDEVRAEEEIIEFADRDLDERVREVIDKKESPIRPEDVKDIETLDISGSFIESLEGIEYLNNLLELNASSNQIENLEPIAELDRLVKVDLSFNEIEDISPLTEMSDIEEINLRENKIEDITPLEGEKFFAEGALLDLRLNNIDITDFDFLYLVANLEDEGLELKFDPQDLTS